MLPRSVGLLLAGVLSAYAAMAQEYRFKQYRVEQGLPSDVVKAVTEDSLGYIWIATDDGLVKYDGLRFTTYKSAFHSQFTKGFLHTRDGRLLAFGDLDFIEIKNLKDTVAFETIIRGTRNPTDSTIWFPKSAFEDRAGNLWIGEPQSMVKITDGNMKRYDLGTQNRSPVFIRSIFFVEDADGVLYGITYGGKIFQYDPTEDKFRELEVKIPDGISHVLYRNGKLWFIALKGFYSLPLRNGKTSAVQMILPVENGSHFCASADSTWWISTYGDDLYKLYPDQRLEALLYNFQGINESFISHEQDVWVATDKGLVLIQRNQFMIADINSQTHFVEDITCDEARGVIYYCYKDNLIELRPPLDESMSWEGQSIFFEEKGYFQSLKYSARGLWASSAFDVLLFVDGKLDRRWNFSREGNFIHDLFLDSHQDLWLSQAASNRVMLIHNKDLSIEKIEVPISRQSEINVVREGSHGMYAGASGINSYLFFKAHDQADFINVSKPVHFKVEGDFNIIDIAVIKDELWLASTEGLLKFSSDSITRIDLGESFTTFPVSSVEALDSVNILFGNSYGLFRFNIHTHDYWLYDENAGLPSNTITDHGIFVDGKKRVWIGTSFGLALAVQPVISDNPTVQPVCVEARVNGTPRRFISGLDVPYGAYVNLLFSAITFPENKILLQWRRQGEKQWRLVQNHEISMTELTPGTHNIEVRAKKNSGNGWSRSEIVTLNVARPYWQRAEFVFLVLFVCILIAWISYVATSRIMKTRKEYLQNLVLEQTQDLQKANEELMVRNTELDRFVYSASHDLSAPLKSVLGLITVARMENPGEQQKQYLTMMERSVQKLEEFIREVVSYSRNTRIPVKIEDCQFSDVVKNLLHDHQYSPNFEKIKFNITDNTVGPMRTDLTRIKIILNNLISNAIKFHRFFDTTVQPYINVSLSRNHANYILVVQDNGSGIDDQHLEHIFEMFYRASEQSQGSGLGLYILQESVAKLNGKVEAHSTLGIGTTFTITLPVPEASLLYERQ